MSVQGKSKNDWVALTITDFNDQARREVIRHHFSIEAAVRAWQGILKIYGGMGRVWQETKEGDIINESP